MSCEKPTDTSAFTTPGPSASSSCHCRCVHMICLAADPGCKTLTVPPAYMRLDFGCNPNTLVVRRALGVKDDRTSMLHLIAPKLVLLRWYLRKAMTSIEQPAGPKEICDSRIAQRRGPDCANSAQLKWPTILRARVATLTVSQPSLRQSENVLIATVSVAPRCRLRRDVGGRAKDSERRPVTVLPRRRSGCPVCKGIL